MKLTEPQIRILKEGAAHRDGVVRPSIAAGFSGVTTKRNVAILEREGMIVPNAHGDHYITDKGREAIPKA